MRNKPKKILIIKTGYSEFLDRGISTTVSYGDVLICTSVLHLYKKDHVTWVTSWAAKPILEHNPYIDELMIFGPRTLKKILKRPYDVLINLEKDIGICTCLSSIKARRRMGFYFDEKRHNIASFKKQARFLLAGQENQKEIKKTGLEILYETIGRKWKGQGYIFNRPRRRKEKYDIGFNYSVGNKWPTKAWPKKHWKELERLLKKNYSISWQQGKKSLRHYFDWIDRCHLIVTSDSLGQAVAQALGKKVITLFGPTNYRRMRGLENITLVRSPLKCPHLPCYMPICRYHKFCMDYIEPKRIAELCEKILC